ncbi:F-box domain-containing protein [Heracleum sosnowskyi]|uniref:F-box domain-containing protein n=1 Tax=Heracleum sosnowskyi TaxID=360622 RepID=A0AAD8I7F2_9APIA|nr:F-box domain-containing protein [Heracleum sosnowskyi]
MDYKGALMKGLKEIPSSSLKMNHSQPTCKINPNWLNLPPDLMVLIMQRVDWYDVLMNVKEVCKYWHKLSKQPSVWRVIEFKKDILVPKLRRKTGIRTNYEELLDEYFRAFTLSRTCMDMPSYLDCREVEDNFKRNVDKALHKMVMHAIDLSSGQLHHLCLRDFGSDDLIQHIYQRSSHLRRLRLEYCHVFSDKYVHDFKISEKGLIQMLKNLPLLEELECPYTWIPLECIEVAGRCCPHLRSFISNQRVYRFTGYPESDALALAIAKNMPRLRHLQLFGNRMTVTGLKAILKNCQHLEYLDLRQCYNLGTKALKKADLETKLCQQIKHVRFPQDSTEDYEFDDAIYDSDGTYDL